MFEILESNYFSKKAKKLLGKNLLLVQKVEITVELLSLDPSDPKLHSHKVNSPKFGSCFSSRVTGDIRIIWNYGVDREVEVLDLLDIGGHGEVY